MEEAQHLLQKSALNSRSYSTLEVDVEHGLEVTGLSLETLRSSTFINGANWGATPALRKTLTEKTGFHNTNDLESDVDGDDFIVDNLSDTRSEGGADRSPLPYY